MLDYEWGNTSSMLLPGDEQAQDSDQTRQIFDQYNPALAGNFLPTVNTTYSQNYPFQQERQENQLHFQPILYESRSYAYSYPPPPPPSSLTLETIAGGGATDFMIMAKNEEVYGGAMDYSTRIGLNLGGRTYFSSEDDFVNRLYRRSRPLDAGSSNTPRCQAEGCHADLTHAKHYHRRHKVCEFHSKAATVSISGLTQRFCQQCSRFHLLSEFDQGKRSCRKRLADHNRRRRKSQPQQQKQQQAGDNAASSSSENPISRSSPDSAAYSSSSVTIALSPPRVSLGSFRRVDGQASAASSSSKSSLSCW